MAKSKKIDVKNVILKQIDNTLIIEGFEGEEIPFENLSEQLQEIIKMEKPINIKISKARKGGGAGRKPVHKYRCTSCAKEVKSNEDSLTIKCLECDTDFIKE